MESPIQNVSQVAAVPNQKAANDWAVQLLLAINRKWAVPREGNRNLAATVLVRINTAGTVQYAGISASSGDQNYDNSIVQAIYRSSPLPLPHDGRVYHSNFSICVGANVHGCK
jgi:colicin import membrane protein